LHLFISHWPSRLWCEKDGTDRHLLGIRLRDATEKIIGQNSEVPSYIMIMGDFNDEPFDISLSEHVMATRDLFLAKTKKYLFYNPFWKMMGENYIEDIQNKEEKCGGSYFHKNGTFTRWRTFDQIIFSSAFLGSCEWQLNERLTKILHFPEYLAMIRNSKEIFDHFPVLGVIERKV